MSRFPAFSLIALLVAGASIGGLLGCSGSDPKQLTDAAMVALESGDWQSSLEEFDKALAKMDPADPQYLRASLGRCRALVRIDAEKGKAEFLKLVAAQKARITLTDFHQIIGEFFGRGDRMSAIDVMESAKKLYPDSPEFKKLAESVVTAAQRASDSAALQKLKSLGYL